MRNGWIFNFGFVNKFNPLRGWEVVLSYPGFYPELLLFNPCGGFDAGLWCIITERNDFG